MKDNVQAAARRYTQDLSGKWIDDIDSHYTKIVQKDNRLLGDLTNGIQPFLIQMNTALESGLNQKIATEKYAMKYPLPLRYETVSYYLLSNTKKKIYQNFYFGLTGTLVNSIADTNIYRGTFQNLNSLTGVTVSNDEKSVGGSYHILSQQVEANRGYNLLNLPNELALRSGTKQDLLQEEHCSGIWILSNICIGSVSRNTTYGDNNGFTDIYGSGISHGAQESMTDFAVRIR